MKNLIKLTTILTLLLIGTMSFSSCSSDGDDEDDVNYAAQIAGTYVGTGIIEGPDIRTQSEEGMKVVIDRSSNEIALVTILHADNQDFWQKSTYKVETSSTGYLLTSTQYSADRIIIDRSGNLTMMFTFSINNDPGYSFNFSGKKERD